MGRREDYERESVKQAALRVRADAMLDPQGSITLSPAFGGIFDFILPDAQTGLTGGLRLPSRERRPPFPARIGVGITISRRNSGRGSGGGFEKVWGTRHPRAD